MRTRRPVHDLAPGDTIGGYELLHPAARGGFATVWAARRRGPRGFDPIVALKLLHDDLRGDPDAEAMFFDEAQTAAAIIHPNVGQVLDFGEDDGRPFLVMEWIDGESLAAILSARRATGLNLPLPWILHVAAAACAGLHAAHELRDEEGRLVDLVHRDVSPQNVMVTWDGVVKVVDFGVAKSRRRVHVTRVLGTLKGKVGYFSPEQIEGRVIDRRSDIFSFGTMLYLLVTGVHPFRKAEDGGTIASIARAEVLSPRALVPGLSDDVVAVLEKALTKDPAARYQSAAELELAIEDVIVRRGLRLAEDQVGEFVRELFPDAIAEREVRIARAIEEAEAARAERLARRVPSSAPPDPRRVISTVRPGAPRPTTRSERAAEETLAAPEPSRRVPLSPAARMRLVPVGAAVAVVALGLVAQAIVRRSEPSPRSATVSSAPMAITPSARPSASAAAPLPAPASAPTTSDSAGVVSASTSAPAVTAPSRRSVPPARPPRPTAPAPAKRQLYRPTGI